MTYDQRFAIALNLIRKANDRIMPEFDEQALKQALLKLDGNPVPIYQRLSPIEDNLKRFPQNNALR